MWWNEIFDTSNKFRKIFESSFEPGANLEITSVKSIFIFSIGRINLSKNRKIHQKFWVIIKIWFDKENISENQRVNINRNHGFTKTSKTHKGFKMNFTSENVHFVPKVFKISIFLNYSQKNVFVKYLKDYSKMISDCLGIFGTDNYSFMRIQRQFKR